MNSILLGDVIPVDAVRWFYGNGLVHTNLCKPFRGRDSIKIENVFRELSKTEPNEALCSKVIVRGDLFEVDVEAKQCSPIYWSGQKRSVGSQRTDWCTTPIHRGIWYNKINWVPLDVEMADEIEREHVDVVIPKLSTQTEGKSRRSSIPIQRGYRSLADSNDCKPPITNLCFVVHGIGQQMHSIRHECSRLRNACLKVIKKHYPKLMQSGKRLEFIPVDWRSSLDLNCATLENITIGQMRPLRMYINNCFVDVLYYTSPVYRAEIMKSLNWELLRLYNIFLRNHPQFLQRGGQVSTIAHSLGSVIMYDLLRSANRPLSFMGSGSFTEEDQSSDQTVDHLNRQIETTRSEVNLRESSYVDLRIGNLYHSMPPSKHFTSSSSSSPTPFSFESPRQSQQHQPTPSTSSPPSPPPQSPTPSQQQQQPQRSSKRRNRANRRSNEPSSPREAPALDLNETDPEALIPFIACRRLYNIFHSYDPIAYRLEPLLLKHYSTVSPVVLPTRSEFLSSKIRKQKKPGGRLSQTEMQAVLQNAGVSSMPPLVESPRLSLEENEQPLEMEPTEICESNTESEGESDESQSEGFPKRLRKRISVTANNQVYRQPKPGLFKFFSKILTRRSSHVTTLGPMLQRQRTEPEEREKHLLYRVDYEWQKSFSPLAVLGAHYSYWNSKEVAFFILYQMFGHPDEL